jgi:hypothetical protein
MWLGTGSQWGPVMDKSDEPSDYIIPEFMWCFSLQLRTLTSSLLANIKDVEIWFGLFT